MFLNLSLGIMLPVSILHTILHLLYLLISSFVIITELLPLMQEDLIATEPCFYCSGIFSKVLSFIYSVLHFYPT